MEAAAVGTMRGGNVRFVALDREHAPLERELKGAFVRMLGSSALTLGAEVERFEAEFAEYSQTQHRVERVAEAVHAAVCVPKALSGENRC